MSDSENTGIKKESTSVEASNSVPFPPFWHEMPGLWFVQAEAVFSNKRITSDNQQYLLTVAALPVDIIATVSDILTKPPETGKFAALKSEVIKRLSLSETQRLEKLIGATVMGDLTPSAFYRRLQQLAGSSTAVTDELIKTLWLKRLPDQLRSIILVQESETIEKLTCLADKIWEFHSPSTSSSGICVVSKPTETPTTGTVTLESLAVAINELRQHVFKQNRSRSRNYSLRNFCFYHY